jgi:hypothetical protein
MTMVNNVLGTHVNKEFMKSPRTKAKEFMIKSKNGRARMSTSQSHSKIRLSNGYNSGYKSSRNKKLNNSSRSKPILRVLDNIHTYDKFQILKQFLNQNPDISQFGVNTFRLMLEFLRSFFPQRIGKEYGKYLTIVFEKLRNLVEIDLEKYPKMSLDLLKMFSPHPDVDSNPNMLHCQVSNGLLANTQVLIDQYKELEQKHLESMDRLELAASENKELQ